LCRGHTDNLNFIDQWQRHKPVGAHLNCAREARFFPNIDVQHITRTYYIKLFGRFSRIRSTLSHAEFLDSKRFWSTGCNTYDQFNEQNNLLFHISSCNNSANAIQLRAGAIGISEIEGKQASVPQLSYQERLELCLRENRQTPFDRAGITIKNDS